KIEVNAWALGPTRDDSCVGRSRLALEVPDGEDEVVPGDVIPEARAGPRSSPSLDELPVSAGRSALCRHSGMLPDEVATWSSRGSRGNRPPRRRGTVDLSSARVTPSSVSESPSRKSPGSLTRVRHPARGLPQTGRVRLRRPRRCREIASSRAYAP